jgi:hemoglobin
MEESELTLNVPEGVDETQKGAIELAIGDCVERFYAKGAADPLLGPVFAGAIADFPAHLEIVKNFWSHALLGSDRYRGQPYPVHTRLPIEPEHFRRWLDLFVETAQETLPDPVAGQAAAKAAHMTDCFQAGIFPFTGVDGKPSRRPPR